MKNKNRKDQGDPQQILAGRLTGRASDFDSDLCWFESNPASKTQSGPTTKHCPCVCKSSDHYLKRSP